MRCPECGTDVDSDDYFCPECGIKLKEESYTEETSGFAKASFVLGIFGMIFFFLPLLSFLAILFGVIALVKISNSNNLSGKGLAVAGLIMGLIICIGITVSIIKFPQLVELVKPLLSTVLSIKL